MGLKAKEGGERPFVEQSSAISRGFSVASSSRSPKEKKKQKQKIKG